MNYTQDSAIVSKPDGSTETEELHKRLVRWTQEAEGHISETHFRTESEEDYEFYAGRQDTQTVLNTLAKQKRPASVFNTILPKINRLCGFAGQANRAPYVYPVGQDDQALVELMNNAFKFYRNKLTLRDIENECFEHSVKAGRSFLYFYVNQDNPLKPEIRVTRLPGRDVLMDQRSIRYDQLDARFCIINRWFCEDDLLNAFPDVNPAELKQNTANWSEGPVYYDMASDLYRLSECWYRKYVDQVVFMNPQTRQSEVVDPELFAQYKAAMAAKGFEGDLQEKLVRVKKVFYAIFSGTKIIEQGPSPYKHQHFPVVLFGAYKDENENRWFSVISMMKDPQRGRNAMRRQLVHLLNTAPKGILMHEVGSILNIDEYDQRSSEPNFRMEFAKGALDKARFSDQPLISPIYKDLDLQFEQDEKDTSGIQDSLLGIQTSSREPGITVRMRQETGFAVLYMLFDHFRRSRIRSGQILLCMMQQYVTEPELIRIEGVQGVQLMQVNTQLNPQSSGFNDISAGEYDAVIDEAVDNSTMRMTIAQLMMDFSQNSPGTIPPDLIMEYSDLPFSVQQRVKEYNQMMLEREERMAAVEQETKRGGILMKAASDEKKVEATKAKAAAKPKKGK